MKLTKYYWKPAAIEQFDSLRKMLRRELGVDPLPTTLAKYESLIKLRIVRVSRVFFPSSFPLSLIQV